MLWMLRLKNCGCATLADFAADRISCECLSDHVVTRHGANLIMTVGRGKRARGRVVAAAKLVRHAAVSGARIGNESHRMRASIGRALMLATLLLLSALTVSTGCRRGPSARRSTQPPHTQITALGTLAA